MCVCCCQFRWSWCQVRKQKKALVLCVCPVQQPTRVLVARQQDDCASCALGQSCDRFVQLDAFLPAASAPFCFTGERPAWKDLSVICEWARRAHDILFYARRHWIIERLRVSAGSLFHCGTKQCQGSKTPATLRTRGNNTLCRTCTRAHMQKRTFCAVVNRWIDGKPVQRTGTSWLALVETGFQGLTCGLFCVSSPAACQPGQHVWSKVYRMSPRYRLSRRTQQVTGYKSAVLIYPVTGRICLVLMLPLTPEQQQHQHTPPLNYKVSSFSFVKNAEVTFG